MDSEGDITAPSGTSPRSIPKQKTPKTEKVGKG
jgi:hypothetical protein